MTFSKHTQAFSYDMAPLADDPRAFMAATADVAGEKVGEAHKRLSAVLAVGKKNLGRVEDRAANGAKCIYTAVRKNPYQAIAIAIGFGALVTYLTTTRGGR